MNYACENMKNPGYLGLMTSKPHTASNTTRKKISTTPLSLYNDFPVLGKSKDPKPTTNARLRFQMLKKSFALVRKHFGSVGKVPFSPAKTPVRVEECGSLKGKIKYNNSFNIQETQITMPKKDRSVLGIYGNKDPMIYHCSYLYKFQESKAFSYHSNPVETMTGDLGNKPKKCTEQGVQATKEVSSVDAPVTLDLNLNTKAPIPTQDAATQTEATWICEKSREKPKYWERYKEIADEYVTRVFRPICTKLSENQAVTLKTNINVKVEEILDNGSKPAKLFIPHRPRTVKTESKRTITHTRNNSKSGDTCKASQGKPQQNERAQGLLLEKKSIPSKIVEYEQMLLANSRKHRRVVPELKINSMKNMESQTDNARMTENPPTTEKMPIPTNNRRKINISIDPDLKREDSYYSNAELDGICFGQRYNTPRANGSPKHNYGLDKLVRVDTPSILKVHKRSQSTQVPKVLPRRSTTKQSNRKKVKRS